MTRHDRKPFLYAVVCAAGIAQDVGALIAAAQERNWEVGVIATPLALRFFDTAAVEERTGRPILPQALNYVRAGETPMARRAQGDPRPFPDPDAVVVAPATFNTINKCAAGISDTLALGTLCEAYGLGVPIAVLPCVSPALAATPPTGRAWNGSAAGGSGSGTRTPEVWATTAGARSSAGSGPWTC